MRCKKCGSTRLEVIRSGPHFKLVCGECLEFQKFLKKSQAKDFLKLKELEERRNYDNNFQVH